MGLAAFSGLVVVDLAGLLPLWALSLVGHAFDTCSLLPHVQHRPCFCFLSTSWLYLHPDPRLQPWSVRKNLQGAPSVLVGDVSFLPSAVLVVVVAGVAEDAAAILSAGVAPALGRPRKATCSNSESRARCKSSTAPKVGFTSTSKVYRTMLMRKRISL